MSTAFLLTFTFLVLASLAQGGPVLPGRHSSSFTHTEVTGARYKLSRVSEYKISPKGPGGSLDEDLAEFHTVDTVNGNIWLISSPEKVVRVFKVTPTGTLSEPCVIDLSAFGSPNSVYYQKEAQVVAVALAASPKTNDGRLLILNANTYEILFNLAAGANPDHVSFGTGHTCVYTANEGEHDEIAPNTIGDAVGGLTYACLDDATKWGDKSQVPMTGTLLLTSLSFSGGEEDAIRGQGGHQGIQAQTSDTTFTGEDFGISTANLGGTTPSLLSDLEPEYITYGTAEVDGSYEIYVNCQENNLFVVYQGNIDGSTVPTFQRVQTLGYKDFNLEGNGADFCRNEDKSANVTLWPDVLGMFQPDTIKMIRQGGVDYIVTANEGDAFTRGEDILGDSFKDVLNEEDSLKLTDANGNKCDDKKTKMTITPPTLDKYYVFGGRSFSVFEAKSGVLVYDSGESMEKFMLEYFPQYHNADDGASGERDKRSSSKGPEPESLTSGTVDGKELLFVGLERPGTIGIWDVTNITVPVFHSLNGFDDGSQMLAIDPEAITFIPASDSPSGRPMLVASGAVSNTLTLYEITTSATPPAVVTISGADPALVAEGSDLTCPLSTVGPASQSFSHAEVVGDRYKLNRISEYKISPKGAGGVLDEDLAEFHAVDTTNNRVWLISSPEKVIRIFPLDANAKLRVPCVIDLAAFGSPNSVYYQKEAQVVAVALAASPKTDNGKLVILDANTFEVIHELDAGANPDHVSFGTGHACVYTANEGEHGRASATTIQDAIGGITYACLDDPATWNDKSQSPMTGTLLFTELSGVNDAFIRSNGGHQAAQAQTSDVTFTGVNFGMEDLGGTSPSFLTDLEPEYITYGTAEASGSYEIYVNCQENNLFAVYQGNVSGTSAPVFIRFQPLGYKDFNLPGNGADFCRNEDKSANITLWPDVLGMYQPDTIKMIRQGGVDYIVTANEGDAFTRGEDILGDAFKDVLNEEDSEKLTDENGNKCDDKKTKLTITPPTLDKYYVFGGRSFSVFNAQTGELVYDSGDSMETFMLQYFPQYHNADGGDSEERDKRSSSKGPEPESLTSGTVDGKELLFVGLERPGTIGIWDITDITAPVFHSLNGFDDGSQMLAIDPEAITFIPASDSPSGNPLLIASGAVSNTLTVYEIELSSTAPGVVTISGSDPALVEESAESDGICPVVKAGPESQSFTHSEVSGTRFKLDRVSEYKISAKGASQELDEDLAEFHAVDTSNGRVWLISSPEQAVRVFPISSAGSLMEPCFIDLSSHGVPNSIYYQKESQVVAVALAANTKTENGKILIIDANSFDILRELTAGANPDHVSFGTGHTCVYTANEGEHGRFNDTAVQDAVGGITYACISDASRWADLSQAPVTGTLLFTELSNIRSSFIAANGGHHVLQAQTAATTFSGETFGIEDLGGSNPSLLEDLEPEYITYGTAETDGSYEIYVNCQENNLFAVYEGNSAGTTAPTFKRFQLLGYKDFDLVGNGADFCRNEDKSANITLWPDVLGMYQPDTIKMIRQEGVDYIVTANEGDAFTRGEDILGDSFKDVINEEDSEKLTDTNGNKCDDKKIKITITPPTLDKYYVFGGRSFSVFNAQTGELVYDSGESMEAFMLEYFSAYHNADDGASAERDKRSSSKGPEPESLTAGTVNGRELLFVGLERPGTIGIWDITDITAPVFHSLNGFDDGSQMLAIDPEAITFIPASDSPSGKPMLVASGAVSNTLTLYEITTSATPPSVVTISGTDTALVSEGSDSLCPFPVPEKGFFDDPANIAGVAVGVVAAVGLAAILCVKSGKFEGMKRSDEVKPHAEAVLETKETINAQPNPVYGKAEV